MLLKEWEEIMCDSKKLFLMSMLSTLLIFSNIIASKTITIFSLPVSCSIFVYLFTFLCIALLNHYYGKEESFKCLGIAIICQIIFFIISIFVCNLKGLAESQMISKALQVLLAPESSMGFFHPSFKLMIGTILAFGISQGINIVLYNFLRKYLFKVLAVALAIMSSVIVDAIIFIFTTKIGAVNGNIINTLVGQFSTRIFMTILLVLLFSIFTLKKEEKEGD